MAHQETNRSRDGHDSVLRTFALLVGSVIVLLALAILANGLFLRVVGPSFTLVSGPVVGCVLALGVGAFFVYWGAKRLGSSNKKVSEKSLSRLVRRYEREGRTKEAEDAREQLIELLIEKDEQKSRKAERK